MTVIGPDANCDDQSFPCNEFVYFVSFLLFRIELRGGWTM